MTSFETGAQHRHRFRPSASLSLLPSLLVGYQLSIGGARRLLASCVDCPV